MVSTVSVGPWRTALGAASALTTSRDRQSFRIRDLCIVTSLQGGALHVPNLLAWGKPLLLWNVRLDGVADVELKPAQSLDLRE